VVDVGAKEVDAVKPLLRDLPDIIVGTPGRLAQHLKYVDGLSMFRIQFGRRIWIRNLDPGPGRLKCPPPQKKRRKKNQVLKSKMFW
jgi:hypothetical protein